MSTKGVYSALSGALAQSLKLDTIANNLANVNTPAFKRDQQLFNEYLTANEKPPEVIQVPRVPGSIESFYDMQGGDKSFVDTKGTFTDFSQGSLRPTGNTLDVAIDGKGFFEVATPTGVKLTRAGNFTLDGNGQLVTKDGFPVLKNGEMGEDPSTRTIQFDSSGPITISDNGDISQGTEVIARLSLVDVKNPDSLQKTGNLLYGFKPNMAPEITNLVSPSLKQGFVEGSNVNIVQEMTDMIQTNRVFESTQKAISTYDSMSDKLVNVVGKTN
ncbi:MAG: flagellar basal-body rod protein FlgF [Bdellovibrionaceae bacterium]|nr:flagellar basal-body rod protein FlgF [Pseudobdellovibrionaceae bacterium]